MGGACAGAGLVPDASNVDQVRAATLCLINDVRAAHGLPRLSPNARLQSVAQKYSQRMVSENFLSHTSPDGTTAITRILASGYVPTTVSWAVGENLGWGTLENATPAAVVSGWVNSPTHFANIVDPRFRESGIGVALGVPPSLDQANGATYAQEFGVVK